MGVSERSLSERTVVETFVGRFDQHARQDFKWRIDHAITQGYRFVVLNMVAVSFIDSAALGWLVLGATTLSADWRASWVSSHRWDLCGISLELTEINEWIPIFTRAKMKPGRPLNRRKRSRWIRNHAKSF